ncbi:5-formyltetrahydrofolate cyclo-ligase [Lunatimonas lonarensis]|nr:5-formyltetrahydrofolate cyclo-ligase [Lunatimonas lonarensis]
MVEEKKRIRREYKQKRAMLGQEQRKQLCADLSDQAVAFLSGRQEIQHIHVFLPIERLLEIDTGLLINRLFLEGKKLYTSVTDFDRQTMQTVLLAPDMKWKKDQQGISIPDPLVYEEDEHLIDLVFVPLLAFDLEGYRIGYGMGYYDRFFSRIPQSVWRVGLSYFEPERLLPREPHDVPLHACVMPNKWMYFQ